LFDDIARGLFPGEEMLM